MKKNKLTLLISQRGYDKEKIMSEIYDLRSMLSPSEKTWFLFTISFTL